MLHNFTTSKKCLLSIRRRRLRKLPEQMPILSVACSDSEFSHLVFFFIIISSTTAWLCQLVLFPSTLLILIAKTFVVVSFNLEQLLEMCGAEQCSFVWRVCVHSENTFALRTSKTGFMVDFASSLQFLHGVHFLLAHGARIHGLRVVR